MARPFLLDKFFPLDTIKLTIAIHRGRIKMKKRHRKTLLALLLCFSLLILEALPFGAVLSFAKPPESGGVWRTTYSYFSLVPFGYANFGPFLTAILSVLLLLLLLLRLFFDKKVLIKLSLLISSAAFSTSLMPLLFGLHFFSVLGSVISFLLLLETLLLFQMMKE